MGSETQTCIHCGDPLPSRRVAHHALYCGGACKRTAMSRRHYKRRGAYGLRVCEVPGCGATYRATDKDQRTCSRRCGWMLHWIEAGKPVSMPRLHGQHTDLVVCPVCGRRSEKKGNRVYCPPCHEAFVLASRALSWAQNLSANPTRECLQCGAAMPRGPGCGGRATCPTCAKANAKALDAATRNHRKRARKAGVNYEPVNKWRVFERDGYRCHICGRKTSKRGGPFSPRYPTLDHLVPFAARGPHSYANTACACRECNTWKGAGVSPNGDQLRLVG